MRSLKSSRFRKQIGDSTPHVSTLEFVRRAARRALSPQGRIRKLAGAKARNWSVQEPLLNGMELPCGRPRKSTG